jgi:histidinol dehydrogenase
MMKLYQYPSVAAENRIAAIEKRTIGYRKKDITDVGRILAKVRKDGDEALLYYTDKFDAAALKKETLAVTKKEMEVAAKLVDRKFSRALNRAARQIRQFHRKQMQNTWISTERTGTLLGQIINPVNAAGIYIPGGKGGRTPLVSSVLMCGIPAKIAGVQKIVMVTPPMPNGKINPHLLVAAQKAGVNEVYKVGSAWAIAALAYGTQTVPKVDLIAGPGNIFVTLAKKLVAGDVGIDMIAGPSEILIIADDKAVPEYIAADLLSQAEHDPLASSMLVTTSGGVAKAVSTSLQKQLSEIQRREIAQASLQKYGAIIVVPDMDTAFALANRIAPEHLELHIQDSLSQIGKVRHAGAVFMGDHTPEPVGDYIAGPNHVLPTAGTARYASALSVDHFTKKTSLIHYSPEAFKREARDIMRLAEIEGLDAHAHAVRIRSGISRPQKDK